MNCEFVLSIQIIIMQYMVIFFITGVHNAIIKYTNCLQTLKCNVFMYYDIADITFDEHMLL